MIMSPRILNPLFNMSLLSSPGTSWFISTLFFSSLSQRQPCLIIKWGGDHMASFNSLLLLLSHRQSRPITKRGASHQWGALLQQTPPYGVISASLICLWRYCALEIKIKTNHKIVQLFCWVNFRIKDSQQIKLVTFLCKNCSAVIYMGKQHSPCCMLTVCTAWAIRLSAWFHW